MNENEAKAILIANLKGAKTKRTPLPMIGQAVRLLIQSKEYGSSRELAKAFGVSRSIIESFDKINDQPPEIQELIQQRRILLDANTKLMTIKDLARRSEIAKAVAGLSAFDTRYTIDYCRKHPELSPEECKKAVENSKVVTRETHILVTPLSSEQFKEFESISKKANLTIEEAVKVAILEWINKQESE
jgi:DNA-directed RNA polymerase subunit F